ncbi:MAG: dinuclear metal center YbgI/SA1388 family protein [Pseudohongiellaceae bacterium]|jgi:dinuclear metal center YbgI/SA1388 family protein
MSENLKNIVNYLDDYLDIGKIKDYCPNGLQVEGRPEIYKILGGVTASQALIDEAIRLGVDAVLVHHGYFWKGEQSQITGIKRKRLKALLENDISLLAYHLPLDVHPEVGNNIQLAKKLNFTVTGPLEPLASKSIGLVGELSEPMSGADFRIFVGEALSRECLHIGDEKGLIRRIAWCTGAAQSMMDKAVDLGVDAFLSGEISEPTVHTARETGVHYFSAGHHATERYGVQALGHKLEVEFDIQFQFIDIDNPV